MSGQFKIPTHIKAKFNKLDKEGREQLISEYKAWFNNPFTELLMEDLERKYEALLAESEGKSDFTTLFQSKYYDARNKAKRQTLRGIVEQCDYRVNQ